MWDVTFLNNYLFQNATLLKKVDAVQKYLLQKAALLKISLF